VSEPPEPLTNAEKNALKRQMGRLEPVVKVGHAGVTDAVLRSLDDALKAHELVKLKFAAFRDRKKQLAPQMARDTGSELVAQVGHVAVYYRRKGAPPAQPPTPPPPAAQD